MGSYDNSKGVREQILGIALFFFFVTQKLSLELKPSP